MARWLGEGMYTLLGGIGGKGRGEGVLEGRENPQGRLGGVVVIAVEARQVGTGAASEDGHLRVVLRGRPTQGRHQLAPEARPSLIQPGRFASAGDAWSSGIGACVQCNAEPMASPTGKRTRAYIGPWKTSRAWNDELQMKTKRTPRSCVSGGGLPAKGKERLKGGHATASNFSSGHPTTGGWSGHGFGVGLRADVAGVDVVPELWGGVGPLQAGHWPGAEGGAGRWVYRG